MSGIDIAVQGSLEAVLIAFAATAAAGAGQTGALRHFFGAGRIAPGYVEAVATGAALEFDLDLCGARIGGKIDGT